jgi:isoleucyl-tRNA synthetase
MSKSLRNYPDPYEMFDTYGADAMRWLLLSSPILRGTDLIVTEQGIRDAARHVLLPLWNAWYFFTLYANTAGAGGASGYRARYRTDPTDVLDRYLLAKLRDLVDSTTAAMDQYDLFAACAGLRAFLDTLTNWYIRRSRDRFWSGDTEAFDTLSPLHVFTQLAAGAAARHRRDLPRAHGRTQRAPHRLA